MSGSYVSTQCGTEHVLKDMTLIKIEFAFSILVTYEKVSENNVITHTSFSLSSKLLQPYGNLVNEIDR